MRHAVLTTIEAASLGIRFWFAWTMISLAVLIVRLGALTLPKSHPSRTYILGRIGEGADRMKHAARAPRRI